MVLLLALIAFKSRRAFDVNPSMSAELETVGQLTEWSLLWCLMALWCLMSTRPPSFYVFTVDQVYCMMRSVFAYPNHSAFTTATGYEHQQQQQQQHHFLQQYDLLATTLNGCECSHDFYGRCWEVCCQYSCFAEGMEIASFTAAGRRGTNCRYE